jgi:hypothetical protein
MNKMAGSSMGEDTIGAIQEGIRNSAARMLESGEIDVFIGYEDGTLPLRTTPVFITCPEDAGNRQESYMVQKCFSCDSGEDQIALFPCRLKGESLWVCAKCLPKLIHG